MRFLAADQIPISPHITQTQNPLPSPGGGFFFVSILRTANEWAAPAAVSSEPLQTTGAAARRSVSASRPILDAKRY